MGARGPLSKKKDTSYPELFPVLLKCPDWLKNNKHALTEWERVSTILYDLGITTSLDQIALEGYCSAYAMLVICQQVIQKKGLTYVHANKAGEKNEVQRPEVRIYQQSLQAVKAYAREFGLTPDSRGRMIINTKPEEKGEDKQGMAQALRFNPRTGKYKQ